MKWIGISGSWRDETPKMRADLKAEIAAVIKNGDGIVTGGALGVDYLASNMVIKLDPPLENLRLF